MQGVFDFYGNSSPRRERPERLFFALLPDAGTAAQIKEFSERFFRDHRLWGSRIRQDRLHVSLHWMGDYPRLRSKFVYAARQAARRISLSPFPLTFRLVKSFEGLPTKRGRPHRRPLVLLGEGENVFRLHEQLGAALRYSGLRASPHFVPHMTLLYGPQAVPLQSIGPIRFVVEEFTLIHSRVGLTQYHLLDRWHLSAVQH
ncbi:2'-5' RNA ligase family protein [Rhodoligotrophos defluvii]|uniref:2'-5' RNA ligase family protein n=1 Tax=Rhodoligotrophos defluvii TaxID=2561934 RepID=UPI001485034E|nr:2'-5' RNA ligase family protein [Rhodoligotrophos defluvii]